MVWLTYDDRLADPRRCSARRQRDGEPCGCYAIRGATVCRIHGGMAKQVLRKAKARRDREENLAQMRAIVRRVYEGDYTARPDPPDIPDDADQDAPVQAAERPAEPPAAPGPPANPPDPPAEPATPPPPALATLEDATADVARANKAVRQRRLPRHR